MKQSFSFFNYLFKIIKIFPTAKNITLYLFIEKLFNNFLYNYFLSFKTSFNFLFFSYLF